MLCRAVGTPAVGVFETATVWDQNRCPRKCALGSNFSSVSTDIDSRLPKMADESNQKPDSENGDEQGEVRNDVVVKIGLVGDAQVKIGAYRLGDSCLTLYVRYGLVGW